MLVLQHTIHSILCKGTGTRSSRGCRYGAHTVLVASSQIELGEINLWGCIVSGGTSGDRPLPCFACHRDPLLPMQ